MSKNRKILLRRKRTFIQFRIKGVKKNHPRLYLYNQISISAPKLFNKSQTNDFTQQKKTLLKRNIKNIILEGAWIMK